MKIFQVGELKANFSEVLKKVQEGEEVIISFGRNKKKIAVITPYSKYIKKKKPKLGLLENKATYKIQDTFEMTDDEFIAQ